MIQKSMKKGSNRRIMYKLTEDARSISKRFIFLNSHRRFFTLMRK